jgi:integrase
VQVFDEDLPGFGVRKFSTGSAVYFVKFNVGQQQRRLKLGEVVDDTLDEIKRMRALAQVALGKAQLGMDVVAEKKAANEAQLAAEQSSASALGVLVPQYLATRESDLRDGKLREKTYTEIDRYLTRSWAPLYPRPIAEIKRADVVARVDELAESAASVTADRARTVLSGFFVWAIEREYCETNPTMHVKARASETRRSRVLSEAELVQVWKDCRDDEFGAIVRLLILTGQRRTEIGDLRWPELDFSRRLIELAGEGTKNHRPHVIPLS